MTKQFWAVPRGYDKRGKRLWQLMEGEHFDLLKVSCYEEHATWGDALAHEDLIMAFLLGMKEVQANGPVFTPALEHEQGS